jgi:hypothetical protein
MRLSKNTIILVAPKMMPIATFSPLRLPTKRYKMKSRIVGSLSEFAKMNQVQSTGLMQDLSIDTELSIIQIKTKSQQIINIIHNTLRYFDHR